MTATYIYISFKHYEHFLKVSMVGTSILDMETELTQEKNSYRIHWMSRGWHRDSLLSLQNISLQLVECEL